MDDQTALRPTVTTPTLSFDTLVHDILVVVVPALTLCGYNLITPNSLGDGDSGWHVGAGMWMLDHRSFLTNDPFSFTALGKTWVAHEWLSEILMALMFSVRGWSGVALLYGTAAGALFFIMSVHLRRYLSPPGTLIALLICAIGLMPFMLARPHVLAWPVLALWVAALLRARDGNRAPPLVLALLMILWANLHGSFVFGLLLIGPFALEALIGARPADRVTVLRQWGVFGIICLCASLLTPFGPSGLLFPFQVSSMKVLGKIGEWQAADFSTPGVFEAALLSGIFFCLAKPVHVPFLRLITILGLLFMGLQHTRHQAIFLIVSVLILARPLAQGWSGKGWQIRFDLSNALRRQRNQVMPLVLILSALAAGGLAWRLITPLTRPDSTNAPVSALAQLPDALKRQPVFNEYSFGGALVLDHIPVFIDGRADMYGDEHVERYLRVAGGQNVPAWAAAQKQYDISWTILPPDNGLSRWLDKQPGWHRLYADRWAVIHVNEAQWRQIQPTP